VEVQSELYIVSDEEYISKAEFEDVYEQARRTRIAVRGFINYLKKYETREVKPTAEPRTVEPWYLSSDFIIINKTSGVKQEGLSGV
jgi:hypothetical protein